MTRIESNRQLTVKGLSPNIFQVIEKDLQILDDVNTGLERFWKHQRYVMDSLQCYHEIYKEKKQCSKSTECDGGK